MNAISITFYGLGLLLMGLRDYKKMKAKRMSRLLTGVLYALSIFFFLCMLLNYRPPMPTQWLNNWIAPLGEAIMGGLYHANPTD